LLRPCSIKKFGQYFLSKKKKKKKEPDRRDLPFYFRDLGETLL